MSPRDEIADEVGAESAARFIHGGIERDIRKMLPHLAERPAVKQERAGRLTLELQHFPHENEVIAAVVTMARLAFKTGGALLEQRYAAKALTRSQARKLVGATAREKLCELPLFEGKDVHGEVS